MIVNLYKGKDNVPYALDNWLKSYFKNEAVEPYVILFGSSGNGKSYAVEHLAKEYNLDFLRFTVDDFDNINIIEKSLNLQSINSKNKKIIVFDDIQDIKNKKRLYEMCSLTYFPVIYIADNLSKIDKAFIAEALVLSLKRPFDFQIREILEQKAKELNLTCKNIYDIAHESVSIRTAIQGLYLDYPIEKRPPKDSSYATLKLMSNRVLNEDINWFLLREAFRNIKNTDIKSYRLMEQFAYFDYVINYLHFKNKNILLDRIFFNNMPNIELVKPEFKERTKNNKVSKQKEQPIVKEVEEAKQPTVSSFW